MGMRQNQMQYMQYKYILDILNGEKKTNIVV